VTTALLASPATRRKAVLDTCAVFEGTVWRDEMKGRVQDWLGPDGIAVLPARVIAEIAHVAAKKFLTGDKRAAAAASRANLALSQPEELVGLADARRAVLTRADIERLCRDNADLDLVRLERKRNRKTDKVTWVVVPGDGDFEIAHTVRVLTGADHQAVLVTRDGDLRAAADRLGIALLGRRAPVCGPTGRGEEAGAPLPPPGGAGAVHLLGVNAVVQLLKGKLPVLGEPGDTAVVLSSTLVLAAQNAVLKGPKDADGRPRQDAVAAAAVQRRLDRLMSSGRVDGEQIPVHVWATPWEVYELLAARVTDPLFARDTTRGGAWDMHTLLVLSAAQVLGDSGHRTHLVDSVHGQGEAYAVAGARIWRSAGELKGLAGAVQHPIGTTSLVEAVLPQEDGQLDLSALLRRYGQH
jgi:hypothetical protein